MILILSILALHTCHLYIFLWWNDCSDLLSNFKTVFCWVLRVLSVFWILVLPHFFFFFAKIFSHCGLFFHFLNVFEIRSFYQFVLLWIMIIIISKKSLIKTKSQRFAPMFSFRCCIVLGFTLRSVIHFMFIFVYTLRYASKFFFFLMWYPVVVAPFV